MINAEPAAKLILVWAPAGYGKTVLINSWVHCILQQQALENSIAWFSIDFQDDSPQVFFAYLIKALQRIDPAIGCDAQPLLSFPKLPVESAITSLINDLCQVEHPLKIILDDYHCISDGDIHHAIDYLIDNLPAHVQLAVTSREKPPLALHRLRIYNQLIEIDQHDLRFSFPDATTFLNGFVGYTLSREFVQSIFKNTEGWVAGLQIAALSIKKLLQRGSSKIINQPIVFDKNSPIQDYFFHEVFNQLPEETRTFLLKTSVFDQVNPSLCNAITGSGNSAATLEQLRQANCFITALGEPGEWYRYHPLFANFLISQLEANEIARLKMLGSLWHQKHDMPIEAVRYAFEAGDLVTAEKILTQMTPVLLEKGEVPLLVGWLQKITGDTACEHTILCPFTIWILYQQGKGKEADRLMKSFEDLPVKKPFWYVKIFTEILMGKGQVENALQQISQALAAQENGETIDCGYFNVYGNSLRLSGNYTEALQVYQLTLQHAREAKNLIVELLTLLQTANLLIQQGQPDYALFLCKEFTGLLSGESGSPNPQAGHGFIPTAQIYYETNDLEKAAQYVDDGMRCARDFGLIKPIIQGTLLQAKLALLRGELEEMHHLMYDAMRMAEDFGNSEYRLMAAAECAEMEIRMGNLSAAQSYLKHVKNTLESPQDPLHEQFDLALARLLIAQNDSLKAEKMLTVLEERALYQNHNGIMIRIHILQARALYSRGCYAAAYACLEKAIRLSSPIRYMRSFLDQDGDLLAMLPSVQNVDLAFVNVLCDEFHNEACACTTQPTSDLLKHLSKRQLEIIRLVMENRSNKEIAQSLFISVGTTKWHLNCIYKKLGVSDREGIVSLMNRLQAGSTVSPA